MTVEELINSAQSDSAPPAGLSPELEALWHAKAGNWDQSHDIVNDIHTPTGSWIHALLHLIEGDIGNAGYWFHKANQPTKSREEIDSVWAEIVSGLLATAD